jgi:hypothetical protein
MAKLTPLALAIALLFTAFDRSYALDLATADCHNINVQRGIFRSYNASHTPKWADLEGGKTVSQSSDRLVCQIAVETSENGPAVFTVIFTKAHMTNGVNMLFVYDQVDSELYALAKMAGPQ